MDFGRQVGVENRTKIDPRRTGKSGHVMACGGKLMTGLGPAVLGGRGLPYLKGGNLPGVLESSGRGAPQGFFTVFLPSW